MVAGQENKEFYKKFKDRWYMRAEIIRNSTISPRDCELIKNVYLFDRNLTYFAGKYQSEEDINPDMLDADGELLFSIAVARSKYRLEHKGFVATFFGAITGILFRENLDLSKFIGKK